MQRAVAAAMLSGQECLIHSPSLSADGLASLGIARSFGSEWSMDKGVIQFNGRFAEPRSEIYCGESGLSLRMFVPIASLLPCQSVFTGSGSLTKRPISMLEAPLRQLGAQLTTQQGYLPLTVEGPLQGGFATVDGSLSSQIITGLLMALPLAQKDSELLVKDLQSIPYVDMTLKLLQEWGIKIQHESYTRFVIAGNQNYVSPGSFAIESDWSSASFWLAAAAIRGHITLTGLDLQSKQADKKMLEALQSAGVTLRIGEDKIEIEKSDIQAFEFDATHCPDLFPPLVALAAYGHGITRIQGVQRLTHKESNRTEALIDTFGRLGIRVEAQGDTMLVYGGKVNGGLVSSHNDHRIAMAAAIAALGAEGPVDIQNPACVEKSYPEFFEHLKSLMIN